MLASPEGRPRPLSTRRDAARGPWLPSPVAVSDEAPDNAEGSLLDPSTLAVVYRRRDRTARRDSMLADDGQSAVSVQAWRALAGFTLVPQPGPPPQAADFAAQLSFLAQLLALPDDLAWAVQLRVVAVPDPGAGSVPARLELHVIAAAAGATARLAIGSVREVAWSVAVAAEAIRTRYRLMPLTEPAELRSALRLLPDTDLVELTRRRRLLATPRGGLVVPVPLPTRMGSGHARCHALVAAAARTGRVMAWVATLEPATGWFAARAAIDEAFTTTSEPLMVERGCVGRVQAFLTAADGCVPPAVIAAAIADRGGVVAVADEGPVAPATVNPVVRPKEKAAARAAIADVRCVSWEQVVGRGQDQAGGQSLIGDLERVAGEMQTTLLFGLPIPDGAGLPGQAIVRRPREVWLGGPLAGPVLAPGGLVLGDNVAGGRRQPVVLPLEDRLRHVYIVGQTGTGKSTLILNQVVQDLEAGLGLALIDPHGDLFRQVLARIPDERIADVVIVDPSDAERPVGFNFLDCADDERDQVVESFIGLLCQLYDPSRQGIVGPRFEHSVRNAMHTVMANDGLTLIEVVRVLTDPPYVRHLLPRVVDPVIRRYWTDQIANTSDFHKSEVLDYVASKFSNFVTNRLVRNIVGQSRSTFSPRQIVADGKILLVNLAQGKLGQKLSSFLGSVIVPHILMAALARVDTPEEERRPFALYVDEFQNYATPAFVDIVSGARKYGLAVTMAHQHVGQLPGEVREAILGNVGTQLAMRVGIHDAALLAPAMQPSAFDVGDYVELPNFRAVARVLAGGRYQPSFTLATRPQAPARGRDRADEVRRRSREQFGRPREEVEREIEARAAT